MTIAKEKERLRLVQERQAKEQERQAKEQERLRLEKSILLMLSKGIDADLIAETLSIPKSMIFEIYDKYKS
jgi:helix-turn-helix protein